LKHEVVGNPGAIALDRLIQNFCSHLVEFGQARIEHDFLASDEVNPAFDQLNWDREPFGDRGNKGMVGRDEILVIRK